MGISFQSTPVTNKIPGDALILVPHNAGHNTITIGIDGSTVIDDMIDKVILNGLDYLPNANAVAQPGEIAMFTIKPDPTHDMIIVLEIIDPKTKSRNVVGFHPDRR
jgi:hypothetical protein